MATPYATKVAEAFSSKVMKFVYRTALFDYVVNRDYEGDINAVVSKVNILSFDKLSEKTYDGSNLSVDSLNELNTVLTIDQYKSFYWKERTLDKWISFIKEPKPYIVEQAGNERKKNIDKFILGKYASVAAGNRVGTDYTTGTVAVDVSGNVTGSGTTFTSSMVGRGFKASGHTKWYRVKTYTNATTIVIENDADDVASSYDGGVISSSSSYVIEAATPVALTTSIIMTKVLALKQKLDAQEVPDEDRVLILPTECGTLIPAGSNISLSVPAAYDELVKRGMLTELVGFKVFLSARLTGDNTNGYHALAIQRNWMTFADKVLQAGMDEDLIGNFGTAYKDLYVYGAKVSDRRRIFAAELFCTV